MTTHGKAGRGSSRYQRRSEWRKWDLHIHTPGTAREDKYAGWAEFVQALKSTKDVSVVGITDYLSIANYELLIRQKKDAKFGSIDLLIPNIEFRVTPQTDRGHAVNLHLLIDPSGTEHCDEINRALARLSIEYQRQPYSCTRAEITKLGAAYNAKLTDDDARYREGINQFKVDFAVFWNWYENEAWLREHSLVCAAGGNDGPSGIKDSGWAAMQEEIWRSAHIIFSDRRLHSDCARTEAPYIHKHKRHHFSRRGHPRRLTPRSGKLQAPSSRPPAEPFSHRRGRGRPQIG